MSIPLADLRRQLRDFIGGSWSEYDQDRMDECTEDDLSRPDDQAQRVASLPVDILMGASCIRDLIQRDLVKVMDKESMVAFPASGLYISREGKIVIFNER